MTWGAISARPWHEDQAAQRRDAPVGAVHGPGRGPFHLIFSWFVTTEARAKAWCLLIHAEASLSRLAGLSREPLNGSLHGRLNWASSGVLNGGFTVGVLIVRL